LCYNTVHMETIENIDAEEQKISTSAKVGIVIGLIVLVSAVVGVVYYLLQDSTPTARIRDIFIIFLGFELALIGASAILLLIQGARLVNLFQNEIKPVLEAANETMSTIRGTALFLSDSMVQPVIKINSLFASIRGGLNILKQAFGK
jgi:hypothetical protein